MRFFPKDIQGTENSYQLISPSSHRVDGIAMIQTFLQSLNRATLLLLTVLTLLSFSAKTLVAAEAISAQYLDIKGDTVTLQVFVKSPIARGLIVEQHLPPGTRVLSTAPKAKMINSRSGVVKWLFRRTQPGRFLVTMKIAPIHAKQQVYATLVHKNKYGRMVRTVVKP